MSSRVVVSLALAAVLSAAASHAGAQSVNRAAREGVVSPGEARVVDESFSAPVQAQGTPAPVAPPAQAMNGQGQSRPARSTPGRAQAPSTRRAAADDTLPLPPPPAPLPPPLAASQPGAQQARPPAPEPERPVAPALASSGQAAAPVSAAAAVIAAQSVTPDSPPSAEGEQATPAAAPAPAAAPPPTSRPPSPECASGDLSVLLSPRCLETLRLNTRGGSGSGTPLPPGPALGLGGVGGIPCAVMIMPIGGVPPSSVSFSASSLQSCIEMGTRLSHGMPSTSNIVVHAPAPWNVVGVTCRREITSPAQISCAPQPDLR